MTRTALVLAACLLVSGCASFFQAISSTGPAAFGGTRHWARKGAELVQLFTLDAAEGERHPCTVVPPLLVLVPLLVDGPLSLGMDLVLLPFGACNELFLGGIDVERKRRAPDVED